MRRLFIAFEFLVIATSAFSLTFHDYQQALVGHYEMSVFANGKDLWSGPNEGFQRCLPGYSLDIAWQGNTETFKLNLNGKVTEGQLTFRDLGRPFPLVSFRDPAGKEIAGAWFWSVDFDDITYDSGMRMSSLKLNMERIKRVNGLSYGDNTALLYFMLTDAYGGGLWFFVKRVE